MNPANRYTATTQDRTPRVVVNRPKDVRVRKLCDFPGCGADVGGSGETLFAAHTDLEERMTRHKATDAKIAQDRTPRRVPQKGTVEGDA